MSEAENDQILIGGDVVGECIVKGDNQIIVPQKVGMVGPDFEPTIDDVVMTDLSVNTTNYLNRLLRYLAKSQLSLNELKSDFKVETGKSLSDDELKVRYRNATADLSESFPWEDLK